MAFLTTYTRAQLKQQMALEYAASATLPADTHAGSDLGAIFDAQSLMAVVLQQQVGYVNSIARLATITPNTNGSPNVDVDSFVNPFGVFRLNATPSTGQVTFSVASPPAVPIQIPAVLAGATGGVVVQTTSGVQFQVIVDTTNTAYNPTFQSYTLSAGSTSVSCTVQCLALGNLGNVQAGQISQLYAGPGVTYLSGIQSVSNAAAFSNAVNQETEVALKVRFANVIQTGTVATSSAIAAAILSVSLNLTYSVGDQLNAAGAATPSAFTVIVNNAGTGVTPSAALLTAVQNAVLAVKPAGINFIGAIAPSLVPVGVTANIKVAAGYSAANVIGACTAAYIALINNVGLDPAGGQTLAKLAAVYSTLYTTPGVSDVTSMFLNGSPGDISANFGQQLVSGIVTLSPY